MAAKTNPKNKTRYRMIRSAVVSASLLSFIPVFGLIRSSGVGTSTTQAATAPAVTSGQSATSYNGIGSQTSISQSSTSSSSSSRAQAQTTHTRTRAS